MGIRFHCPNGHKLNVKSFLAGKKGVCPDCGVKVRIPDRSEAGLESAVGSGKHAAPEPQVATTAATTAAPIMSRPSKITATPPPAVAIQPAIVPMATIRQAAISAPVPAVVPPAAVALPPPPPMGRVPGAPADPIAENPLATWFVRPPSGGQFGPARGEVMRKWLTEGRVTSDSLVWREGWGDWLPATEVFPSLGKPTPPLFSAAAPSVSKSSAVPVAKKSGGSMGAVLLIILAVVCVGLTAVLGYVVLSGGFSST